MSKLRDALAPKPVTAFEMFRARVERLRPEIAHLCGKENVDRFVRVTMNAVQANPAVLDADQRSLLIACLKAAQDNLLPDGREAVFNVFNTKVKEGQAERWVKLVQYMPMAYGLVQKFYEAGATLVDAVPVYEADGFEYHRGDSPRIIHEPYSGDDDPGKVVAAYAIVQGAVKTVLHRIAKQMPRAESLSRALFHDREVTGLKDVVEAIEAPVSDVAALIDGRMDAELRDAALRARTAGEAQPVAAGGTPEGAPANAPAGGAPVPTSNFDDVLANYRNAKNADELAAAADLARGGTWTEEQQAKLTEAYTGRLADFG